MYIKKLGGRVSGHKTRVFVLDIHFQAHFCPALPWSTPMAMSGGKLHHYHFFFVVKESLGSKRWRKLSDSIDWTGEQTESVRVSSPSHTPKPRSSERKEWNPARRPPSRELRGRKLPFCAVCSVQGTWPGSPQDLLAALIFGHSLQSLVFNRLSSESSLTRSETTDHCCVLAKWCGFVRKEAGAEAGPGKG